ncbi:pleckstrin homology domain-containing family A member 6 [Platysternon megacephalum]|uniref:Plasma membrane calcium-transporting ATPase 4 n=1 Tax=Platysternon megacephalum TaxID=55544 RepID=A0A4D9DZ27_9SAUR|nr:plasma membrane calcium-transporting ATPase 4 [Platysternon megacephalum]TFK01775.1 pleckstrin homology domain-containing family A member 6 [Platysternon megacephalum]
MSPFMKKKKSPPEMNSWLVSADGDSDRSSALALFIDMRLVGEGETPTGIAANNMLMILSCADLQRCSHPHWYAVRMPTRDQLLEEEQTQPGQDCTDDGWRGKII